ncbi:MAG: TonB-dependent receptor [Candidatus Zixiibacteriota bacterium]
MHRQYLTIFIIMTIVFIVSSPLFGNDNTKAAQRFGTLKGQVMDIETKTPLVGATVTIVGTNKGAAADLDGNFAIERVPVGNYSLKFQSIGYNAFIQTDVIVKSNRITFVNAELASSAIEGKDVTVSAGYFRSVQDEPTSATSFSGEEIRRAPGSAGDVSRIVAVLPSVAKVNDQLNSLIIRGGGPAENAFYLDNIEIPNINHYPVPGTSGGPIGLLNVDFVQDVQFSAGGFSALYGDRLSSVMNIEFREGNRDEFDGQIDFSMGGLSLEVEGPISKGRGSYMISARRSYLDLLVDAIGTGVAPKYSDYQGKFVYDLSPSNKLTFLGVAGVDYIEFDSSTSFDDGNTVFGEFDGYEYAVGSNWEYIWGKRGYSNTSVSLLSTKSEDHWNETKSGDKLSRGKNIESIAQFRNVNNFRASNSVKFEFGIDVKYFFNDYDYYFAEYTDMAGNPTDAIIVNDEINAPKYGTFASLVWNPAEKLRLTFGGRYDYFDYGSHSHVSPRFSASYSLNDRTSINAASGIYYQNLPFMLLSQNEKFKELKNPVSYHYILGLHHMLTKDTRLTLEGYYKDYDNFPINPDLPEVFLADQIAVDYYSGTFDELRDDGKARSYGVELTVQKKLAQNIYGLVSAAYTKAEYEDTMGVWRDRLFDNQMLVSIEGGYKPNEKWEYSLRWIYAGGTPYTPLDLDASRAMNRMVSDMSLVNAERRPAYHSLNLRVDHRYHFGKTNMVLYFSVWNVYNRKNVAMYYWNEIEQKQDVENQWSTLPIIGLEFEF